MQRCDVLIIGGGPAGSTCAWALRRAGYDVIVWDRRPFPRDKICAGWITPQVAAALALDLNAYVSGGRTLQPVLGFRLSRSGDAESCVRYPAPVSYAIRRCEFDDYLLRRSDARLALGQPVSRLEWKGGEWCLNDVISAPLLIGAGGHFCPVAQHLGAELGGSEPIVAAQEIEFQMTPAQARLCPVEAEVPELFFTRDLRGYGWVVRKGDFLNVGLGRQDTQSIAKHVEAFFADLEHRGKIPADRPAKPRGHPYLLYGEAPRPLMADGALLIGDAAGLAYPKSGEGIRPAVESALLAAETVVDSNGRYDAAELQSYADRLVARFGRRRPDRGITDFLPRALAGRIAGRLFASEWFARRIVLDEWFFHANDPPLAPPPIIEHGFARQFAV